MRKRGTGSAGELMDLMRWLLRLREGNCVVFENVRRVPGCRRGGYGFASM